MVAKVRIFLSSMFLALMLFSCRPVEEYPLEPVISYGGFTYLMNADSTFSGKGVLSIRYTDGDGDLGLGQSDTVPPFHVGGAYYYNMFVRYFRLVDGVFVETPLLSWNQQEQHYDTLTFNARFPRLLDSETPKPISGTIDYAIDVANPFSPSDTIMFKVRIADRALRVSNEVESDVIFTGFQL